MSNGDVNDFLLEKLVGCKKVIVKNTKLITRKSIEVLQNHGVEVVIK